MMEPNEIVKMLLGIKVGCNDCEGANYDECRADCSDRAILSAADCIERLQAELEAEQIKRSKNETKLINDAQKWKTLYNNTLVELEASQRRERAAVRQVCNSCRAIASMNGVAHTCHVDCMWRGPEQEGE